MTHGAEVILLFDLGGVLMDFAAFDELAGILPEPLGANQIRKRWLESVPVRDFERGAIGAREFGERFVAEWGLEHEPTEFLGEFERWLRGFYPGVPELLTELRGCATLGCLSNSNPLHWEKYGPAVMALVDRAFISFELGLAKPDPAIFEATISALGVAPAEVVFFDDAEANVESAARVGLRSELVRGPAELERALVRLGLCDRGRDREAVVDHGREPFKDPRGRRR